MIRRTHDPYLGVTLDALGREQTIIALQHYAAQAHLNALTAIRLKSFDHLTTASHFQHHAAWATLNARILMGIEE